MLERNNRKCVYIKQDKGYLTSCGMRIGHKGKWWTYCPCCGKIILAKKEGKKSC